MNENWLYDKVNRVPKISNKHVAEMRHIEPVLRVDTVMFRRIAGISLKDPRNVSFLWDATPTGDEFTINTLNSTTVITQHHSSVFFKPSLAEVYAWIRFYMGKNWNLVKFFCLERPERMPAVTDYACHCLLMGGPILVKGKWNAF